MPLRDSELDDRFVLVTPGQTIGEALEALYRRVAQDDWDLFVRWPEGAYGVLSAAALGALLAELGPSVFEYTFAVLRDRVPDALAVQQDAIGLGTAQRWALQRTPAVLLVLRGEEIVGRFSLETRLGGGPEISVGEMYRSYLDTRAGQADAWTFRGLTPDQWGESQLESLNRDRAARPGPEVPDAYVNTGFAARSAPAQTLSPQTPLASGQAYYFWLSVGAPGENAIDSERVRLEVEQFPAEARFCVVLFGFGGELEITPGATVGVLKLLPSGAVEVDRQPGAAPGLDPGDNLLKQRLFFQVRAPAQEGSFRLRCNLYYNQVLIQSRLVHARVMHDPQPLAGALRTDLDYQLAYRPTAAPVARIPAHQLSIMVNSNGGGTHGFRYFGGDPQNPLVRDVALDELLVQSLIDDARGALRKACWGDANPWTDLPTQAYKYLGGQTAAALEQLKSDLTALAITGYRMFDTFSRELVGALPRVQELQQQMRAPGRVQIALKTPARFVLPAALFYDYPLDTGRPFATYSLCPAFVAALRAGPPLEEQACFTGNCPSYGRKDVVCPGGFWGFRHQLGLPVSEARDSEVAEAIEYQDVPRLTVCVSTDQKLFQRQDHVEAIHKLISLTPWTYAESREQTLNALKNETDLVYFYCHGGLFGANKPYLSVGSALEMGITPDNLGSEGVYWEKPRPLVVINGCHTTAVEPEVALNFVDAFVRTSHAAGVIGTEITVFEPLARDFAEGFLGRFLAGTPLGEAVRRTRLAILKAYNPLGLVYIPFALPSLKLEPLGAPPAA